MHLYTASGSVLGLLIVLAALEGEVETALWLGLATLFVDGTDGMLARRFRVKETIPWFDGALLDNIVDYLTYVFAPIVLLWTTGHLPDGVAGRVVAAVPLLASCYQFCRVDAKTSDHFFLGFPSYWNVVAFYVIVLDTSELVTSVVLLVVRRAGLRADPLPLPVADARAAGPDAGVHAGLAGHLRGAAWCSCPIPSRG